MGGLGSYLLASYMAITVPIGPPFQGSLVQIQLGDDMMENKDGRTWQFLALATLTIDCGFQTALVYLIIIRGKNDDS